MKNEFCKLTESEIRSLSVPDEMRGLLLSPFQHNDNGVFVLVPRETFQRLIDLVAEYAVKISGEKQQRSTLALSLVPDTPAAGIKAIEDIPEPNQETRKCRRKDALTKF